ncbi:hypothetical protein SAMN05428981_11324 [Bacillus sp. OV194]|nr:hypothetical protein SAMN05428981_11324 [Bacillus sp. OV194]
MIATNPLVHYIVKQGYSMGSPSIIQANVEVRDGVIQRTSITGKAIIVE